MKGRDMENSDDTEPLECHSVNEEYHKQRKEIAQYIMGNYE